jgi:hypothetical protein
VAEASKNGEKSFITPVPELLLDDDFENFGLENRTEKSDHFKVISFFKLGQI